ncbi:MAG: hypothetical protein NTZ10_07080 [Candidatus Saganbacteria bacterium]|nr:hypothetical protein [Candidatus Saganbacteria bacterium]
MTQQMRIERSLILRPIAMTLTRMIMGQPKTLGRKWFEGVGEGHVATGTTGGRTTFDLPLLFKPDTPLKDVKPAVSGLCFDQASKLLNRGRAVFTARGNYTQAAMDTYRAEFLALPHEGSDERLFALFMMMAAFPFTLDNMIAETGSNVMIGTIRPLEGPRVVLDFERHKGKVDVQSVANMFLAHLNIISGIEPKLVERTDGDPLLRLVFPKE